MLIPRPRLPARSLFSRLFGLGSGSVLLCAIPLGSKPSAGPTSSLKNSTDALSHRELIKNAATIAVDSSCVLLTHTALAVISLHQEYAKMINQLKLLLEEHAQFAGPPAQEDELWQEIIQLRVGTEDKMGTIEDMNDMLTAAILVLERAAEAAYQADAELSLMTAGQHLQLVQSQLDTARKLSQKAQQELTDIQVKSIKQATAENGRGNLEETGS